MVACDYCCDGLANFCHMCDTKKGCKEHWDLIKSWNLEGFSPCDWECNGCHQEYQRKWLDNMMRYYNRNQECAE